MPLRPLRLLVSLVIVLSCCGILIAAQDQDELTRRVITVDRMAGLAKETYVKAIGPNKVGTINEVLYRGAAVMYEIEQQMDRRRVEIVIRYDGERVPIGQVKRPKRIDKKKMEATKLPEKVSSAVTRNVGQDPVDEARQISYRDTVIIYEIDAGELCYGFFVDGQLAFKTPRPATQPAAEEQAKEDAGDANGDGANGGDSPRRARA